MPLDGFAPELNLPFTSSEIFSPKGAGAKVYSDLAKEKIGIVIYREKGVLPEVGILVSNPESDNETQHPIAIVCKFNSSISQDVIDLTHKLCWNFCHSPLLILIEPTSIKVFSCYQRPKVERIDPGRLPFGEESEFSAPQPIYQFRTDEDYISEEAKSAIRSLQWVELVSGNFFNNQKKHFPREERADKTLLDNLSSIRTQLHDDGLEYDTIHDLLARIIFIQFLFQRKDSKGQSVISSKYLSELYESGRLLEKHEDPEGILRNYDDAYTFFKLLNDRFNGDLFPGDRESDWEDEMKKVSRHHLDLLADFIGGKLILGNGQSSLWQMYSFDTIPLEFISSIYEEFVSQQQHLERSEKKRDAKREKGVYYTKSHLVDFVLDNVLPWHEKSYDLKILDPSCGSGIFLVKAFKRLVHRWENSLTDEEKKTQDFPSKKKEIAINLLERNLFGVDIDKHAVRVASFSLYLALCDELDPRTLWEEVKFPDLRDTQVVERDFFDDDENNPLFRQYPDIRYDVIVGNVPWGRATINTSEHVKTWAKTKGWDIVYKNIGPLFLPKAASLLKSTGFISLIQPAMLLTGQSPTAERFRKRLFRDFLVKEIVNLAGIKEFLFEKAKYPACLITMTSGKSDSQPIQYICPKKRGTDEDWRQITIEPMDVTFVEHEEAIEAPWIWTALMLGNRRDAYLIKRLFKANNVSRMIADSKASARQGIIAGDRKNVIYNKRFLGTNNFPDGTFLSFSEKAVPVVEEINYHSQDSTVEGSFQYPQVFIKHSHRKADWRFVASIVDSKSRTEVLCSRDFLQVHSNDISFLKSAALTFNSSFAAYYLILTDGSFGFYHPKPLVGTFWKVPIADIPEKTFDEFKVAGRRNKDKALRRMDAAVLDALGISDSEKILVNDLFDYTMRDYFAGRQISTGREPTARGKENDLMDYCRVFFKVINEGFGMSKKIRATIFQEVETNLPLRIVAIHLDFPDRDEPIRIDRCEDERLWQHLRKLNDTFMKHESNSGNIYYQRVARIYDNLDWNGTRVPTVYLVKPDQKRYWLRSQALRDADDVATDIIYSKPPRNINRSNKKLRGRKKRG